MSVKIENQIIAKEKIKTLSKIKLFQNTILKGIWAYDLYMRQVGYRIGLSVNNIIDRLVIRLSNCVDRHKL